MDHNALKTEVINDSLHLGYGPLVAAGNDAGVCDLLNAPHDAFTVDEQPVPRWKIKAYLIAANLLEPILVDQAHVSAARARLFFSDPDFSTVDTSHPVFRGVVSGLVTDGLATQAQADAVLALGLRKASRAEVLFGPGVRVSNSDVAQALRGTN